MNLQRIRQFAYLVPAVFSASVLGAVGVNKSFSPNSVVAGQPSTLTIVVLNPNASAATAVALTDTLPAGVVVANPLTVATNTCGFTVGATPGARPIALSGGTIPAISGGVPGQCQVTVDVVSASPNTYLNTIAANAVSSSQGANAQDAQATLVVSKPANITASKAFAPTNVHGGGTGSTLTITLTNPNPIPLTNAAVTDSLPLAVTIAGTPNAGTDCGTGVATPSSSASSPATIALSGGTIPANGSCTISVDVAARNPNALVNGNQTNTIAAGALTTAEGATNAAITANINVQTGAQVTKTFAPSTVAPNGASNLTITVTNFNSTKLTPISFTDTLPATIAATAVPTSTCGTVDTVPAQPAAPPYTALTMTAGSLDGVVITGPGSTTCTVTVPVTGTATATNMIAANNYGGVVIGAANGTLSVSAITGSKSFTTPALQTGSTTMTITLNNLTSVDATITSLRDDLTTMGAGFTVQSGATPAGTCGVTLTSPTPGTLVTASGGTIPAKSSCTIVLPLDISPTSATGNRTDTIAAANNAANGVHTTAGNNTVTITGVVNVQRALTVTKAFNPASVEGGTSSLLTVTMTPKAALTGVGFVDDLTTMGPGFALLASGAGPNPVATNCGGGTVTANPGATSFSLAGASLVAGANCTVAVNIATPAATGTFTDRITAANITTAQGVTTTDVTANLALVSTSVTVNKSFSPTTVAVGAPSFSTLSIQVRNNNTGAINLTGVGLTDLFPTGMAIFTTPTASFSGSGCSGATITATPGATQISVSGASVNANAICTLSVRVVANLAGNLINTVPAAAITSAQGITNSLQGTATLAATGTVNLTIGKTDGVTTAVPGSTTTYTISVSNAGPGDVTGVGVNDSPPAGMSFTSWTCTATVGSACPASGSGPIATNVTVLRDGAVTFVVDAAIAADAAGSITNTATLAIPGSVIDTNPVTSASDTDVLTPQVTLAVGKTDGSASYTPGGTAIYTVTVTDTGISDAEDVTVNDPLPAGVTLTGSVACAAVGIAACGTVTGSAGQSSFGATGALVGAGMGNLLIFTVPVAFAPDTVADPLVNTATATDVATGATASGVDSDSRAPQVSLAVVKTDGSSTYTPGGSAIYTVTITDGGVSDATDVAVTDPLPAGVTLGADVSCIANGSARCGTVSGAEGQASFGATGARVGAGAGNSLVFTVPVTFAADLTADPLDNRASATDAASGATGAGTDSDALARQVSLTVAKTDGTASYTPGGVATYAITVTDTGLSDADDVTFSDTLPPGVTLSSDASCAPTGSADCGSVTGSAGQTSLGTTGARIAAGAGNALTFTAPVTFAANLVDDPLINAATATDVASGASGSGSDSDTRAGQVVLGVAKTDGTTTYAPGGTATYTIVVTNAGPSDARDTALADLLPAGVTLTADASCVAAGTASCGAVTGSSGQASFGTTGAQIAAGAGNALTFTAPVAFASGLVANPLTNTAVATDPAATSPASAIDSDTPSSIVDLAISKADGVTTAVPGQAVSYTIVVSNAGPSDAIGATVSDVLPPVIGSDTWTCIAGGGSCSASGSGSIADTVNVPAGATLTYTIVAQIASGASGSVVNTATVVAPPGVSDSNPGNNSATDVDVLVPTADLSIAKTDGSASYTPGSPVTYTIVVANAGPSGVSGATVADLLPLSIAGATWICTGAGGGGCPASGAGSINAAVTLPSGASATFVLHATISSAASGDLVNTATVTAPAGVTDPNPVNNSATDTDTPGVAPAAATPVPVDQRWALVLVAALLLGAARRALRGLRPPRR